MASPQMLRPPSRASHVSRTSVVSRGAVSMYSVGSVHSVRSAAARSHAAFTEEEAWRPPVLSTALCTTIPRASHVTAVYSIFPGVAPCCLASDVALEESCLGMLVCIPDQKPDCFMALFTIITSTFDVYVLAEAEPGKEHFGYYFISFEFVYAGNQHVRRCLIALALISALMGIVLLVFSVVLLRSLQQENERRIRPWLLVMFFHTCWRAFAFLFGSLVNDLYFVYNGFMCFAWATIVVCNCYGWLVVWSFFNELTEVSKLEDIAHIKLMERASTLTTRPSMGTMTSLNAAPYSYTPSVSIQPCSRPTTPYSYISQPV